jgi:hypothetical protein
MGRTFYTDQTNGNILIANANTYTQAQLAGMAADPQGNIDNLVFHSDFNYLTIKGKNTLASHTIPAVNRILESWSDGGGGGCKIICAKLYEYDELPLHIYIADHEFGMKLRSEDQDAYNGYIKWAKVVVDWMEGDGPNFMFWIRDKEERYAKQQDFFIRLTKRIAMPWAYHMAYQMGYEFQDNRAGRWIMKSGLFISRLVGKYSNTEKDMNVFVKYFMLFFFGIYFGAIAGVK